LIEHGRTSGTIGKTERTLFPQRNPGDYVVKKTSEAIKWRSSSELGHITECATEHPPYWNIIRYSETPGDLSNVGDYEQFRGLLMMCLKRCYDALEPGGRMAVLIGDVRRQGTYTAIIKDVLNFPHGEIRSVIIKVQHNCTSDRRQYGKLEDVPIKHEYCVVFRKTADASSEGRKGLRPLHDSCRLPTMESVLIPHADVVAE
jgi:hypothetical protein